MTLKVLPPPPINQASFVNKLIQYIGKQEIREKLQGELIDPLLNHIMKRVFPYIILTCVLFILLLVVVLVTLGIIIFQHRMSGSVVPGVTGVTGFA